MKVLVLWFQLYGNFICLFIHCKIYHSVLPAWSQILSSSDHFCLPVVRTTACGMVPSLFVHCVCQHMLIVHTYEGRTDRWVHCTCTGQGEPTCHLKHLSFLCGNKIYLMYTHNYLQSLYCAVKYWNYFPHLAVVFF